MLHWLQNWLGCIRHSLLSRERRGVVVINVLGLVVLFTNASLLLLVGAATDC